MSVSFCVYSEYFTYPLQHLKVRTYSEARHIHIILIISRDTLESTNTFEEQDLKRIKKQKMKDIIKAMEAFNENLVGGKRLVKVFFSPPSPPSFKRTNTKMPVWYCSYCNSSKVFG